MQPTTRTQRRVKPAPIGFPSTVETQRLYDDADLNRAVQAYRFFYPTVSGAAIFKGGEAVGLIPNKVFGVMESRPHHVGFTLNSDTPYGPVMLDLCIGPFVVELPPGPLIVVAMDVNQRWVADMGIPGPDAGEGGRHLLLPPGFDGVAPEGFHVWQCESNRVFVGIRSLPVGGDVRRAIDRIKTVNVHPLIPTADWREPQWLNLTPVPQDTTPLIWEKNIEYWKALDEVIQSDPPLADYRDYYGELAALGIVKGRRFAPDERTSRILEQAARIGIAQMRAQSFADRRPDRVVWKDRKWEWVGLRQEDGDFNAGSYVDLDAREVWFYQAIGASPAMFRRKAGTGSLYWLGLRDRDDAYLDGGDAYKLSIPLPAPCKLFWSVTVYDAETRSQIQTDQDRAALRSLFELRDCAGSNVDLFFGPTPPRDANESRWIKTIPGKGWFAYFRLYGPEDAAFDGSWKPGDFERIAAHESLGMSTER